MASAWVPPGAEGVAAAMGRARRTARKESVRERIVAFGAKPWAETTVSERIVSYCVVLGMGTVCAVGFVVFLALLRLLLVEGMGL